MEMYTTKVVLEVEVKHQFDPKSGIGIVIGRLSGLDIPAIKSVTVQSAKSNYQLHNEPLEEMVPIDVK